MESNIFSELSRCIIATGSHETLNLNMQCEALRLQSYLCAKVAVSAIRLASAGFYATGNGDETKCYSCRAMHRGWKSTDNPVHLHRQMSADCRHIADTDTDTDSVSFEPRLLQVVSQDIPRPMTFDNGAARRHSNRDVSSAPALQTTFVGKDSSHPSASASASSTTGLRVLVTKDASTSDALRDTSGPSSRDATATGQTSLRFENAVYPHYSEMAERLKSFATWPKGHCKRPQDLVQGGFFYAGYSDCVRCFVCGVGLRTWEGEDDPWTEHVRWRSSCDYVAAIKGPDFAIQTLASLGRENRNADGNDASYISKTQENADILETDECCRALEMGFNIEQVKQTAMAITRTGGKSSLTLEVLLERMIADEAATTAGSQQTQLTDSAHGRQPLATSDYVTNSEASGDKIESKNHSEDDRHSGKGTEENQNTSNQIEAKPQMPSGMRGFATVPNRCYNSLPPLGASGNINKNKTTNAENSRSLPCYSQTSDEEENRELKESSLCKVCLDEPTNIVFLPCGHLVSCVTCSPALERCPLCRKHIRGTVRIYMANMKSVKQDP